ncbi:hypothetical protein Xbed_00506 [Xenorhabdus beddingii]|uniref:Uncharacterized protein n=1 Tax=Xenorhabdus beddingii TaxID=40578 RepID=A0A1Y2STT9_9GAMM|nr:hypothetical protein Xbed_00506 [Xenorhabdus beddingii]
MMGLSAPSLSIYPAAVTIVIKHGWGSTVNAKHGYEESVSPLM